MATSLRQGFSLMEAIIAGGILAAVMAGIVSYVGQPMAAQKQMLSAGMQQAVYSSVDTIITDLKEAYPPSIDWSLLPPSAGADPAVLAFKKVLFVPGSLDPSGFLDYEFRYDAARRAIVRRVNSVVQEPPVIVEADAPSAADPLFQQDPNPDALHVVVVTVIFHPAGLPPLRLVRRVGIKG